MINGTPTAPHNLEAEKCVLGAILINELAHGQAADVLDGTEFFREAHRRIFAKQTAIADRGEPVDLVTLKDELARSGELEEVGGPAYIAALTDGVPRSANVEYYARIVKGNSDLRHLLEIADGIRARAHDGDSVDQIVDAAERRLQKLSEERAEKGTASLSLPALLERLSEDRIDRRVVLGDLLALGEIAMLHGQPRDGKTWAAHEIAIAIASGTSAFGLERLSAEPRGVLIVSNEDGERATAGRLRMLLVGRRLDEAPANVHLIVGQGCDFDSPIWQRRVIEEIRRLQIAVLIVDPVRSVTRCADQGPNELQPFARFLRRLIAETGVCILLVHHDAKPAAGVTDTRRRAQRASGGAIFSIVDGPIHVERIDERQSLIAPDGFKFCADPQSFVVGWTFDPSGEWARLTASDAGSAVAAGQVVLHAKIAGYLRENPGKSGRDIARAVKVHRQTIADALESMYSAGTVDAVDGAHRARLWTVRS